MLNILFSFLWVSFFEFLQNVIAVSGVVNVVQEYKKKRPLYGVILGVLSGTLTYMAIGILENRKLLQTTQAAGTPFDERSFGMIALGSLIFIVGILGASQYYMWQKTSMKTDIILGVVTALLLSALEIAMVVSTEGPNQLSIVRMISHTIAFLVAFPVTIAGIRKIIALKEGKTIPLTLLVTLIMTLIITAVDYGPFLKR